MKLKQSSWKFFVGIGILLLATGAYVYPMDDVIGIIGIILGLYNIYKGINLARGKQPYLIRKQKESLEKRDIELQDQLNDSKKDKE